MARDTRRSERVAEAIRVEVASYLTTGLKDPRIEGLVTVTGVDVTPDLRRAQVYVSIMGNDSPEATVAALNDVGNKIKGQIGRDLKLRLAPDLEFKIDLTAARVSRIESLLQQIKSEKSDSGNQEGSADQSSPSKAQATDESEHSEDRN